VGLLWLWTTFATVAALFILASAPSRISLLAPQMSFVKFVSEVNWRGIFADGETLVVLLILVGAATLVGAYSMTKPVLGRLGLALIGALAPAIALTDRASEFLGWSVEMPYRAASWTLQALAGRGDGQFYRDGPFFFVAVGWWTVFCLVLALRESFLLLGSRRAAEPDAAPNGGPATPLANSGVTEGPPSVS